MTTMVNLRSEKYGNFSIEQWTKNQFVIWWDYYDEQDGFMMEPDDQIEAALDLYDDCDVRDFSDLPKDGIFKSLDAAKSYIIRKFGDVSFFNENHKK